MPETKLLAPGTRLGAYVVQCPIGQGALGVVYRAHHQHWPGRVVAVKVARDESGHALLVRSGIQQGRFDHPGIVRVLDVDHRASPPFVVLEWIEGETLAQRLGRGGPLPLEQARALMDGVAAALAAIHDAGHSHGDLKPSNILLGLEGRVAVADFGGGPSFAELARGVEWSLGSTPLAHAVGTLGYMAPEQRAGRASDPAGDLYSLGAIWFEMLSGRLPALSDQLLHPGANALYHALVAPAGQRLASAGALRDRLARLDGPAASPSGARSTARPVAPAREPDPARRAVWVFTAVFAALAAGTAGFAALAWILLHHS